MKTLSQNIVATLYVLPVLRIVLFIHTDTDHTDHVVEVLFSFYSKARIFGEIRKEEIFVNIQCLTSSPANFA